MGLDRPRLHRFKGLRMIRSLCSAATVILFAHTPGVALDSGPTARTIGPIRAPYAALDLLSLGPVPEDGPQVSSPLLSLYKAMPTNGTYISNWTGISYTGFQAHALESLDFNTSADGDHQRSQVYIRSTTSAGGDVAEYPLFVDMLAAPAQLPLWTSKTTYAAGALVKANGRVFKATKAGTSAASGQGPNSNGSTIADGSVIWEFRCADQCDAKIAAGITATSMPGSGNVWSMTTNTVLRPGAPTRFAIGYESDFTNYSENCPIDGKHFCVNLWLYGNTKYTNTAGLVISTGAPAGTHAYYFGMWIQAAQGGNVARDADIANDGSAKVGLSFGETSGRSATHSTATVRDLTTTPIGYEFSGAYSKAAINLQGAALGASAHGMMLAANQDVCFNGGNACWFWSPSDARMKLKIDGSVVYSIDANGAVRAKGGFNTDASP